MDIGKIGPYQILEKIGEGGMGVVYKGLNSQTKEVVAIKTLKETVNKNSETFIRFKKEAELLENLHHPNILKFIDFMEKEGRLYIITEYIQGRDLKDIISSNELDLEEKVSLILQIARALDYVHSQGIIHRDIKPSNIIMNREKVVKVLDFGVANLLNFQKLFQRKDGVVGSFAYMAPEQSGILKRNIDSRADLYSLGIMFYHLITGQLPYQAQEVGELIHQHIAQIPIEPNERVRELSPIINKMILKLIRKDPDDRYQTAFGLAEDIEIYVKLSEEQKKTFYLELAKKDRLKNLNYRTRLVGRKRELRYLLDHLNHTVLNKGAVSMIIGKSGMGKSRLVSELQKFSGSKNAFYIPVSSGQRNQNQPYYPLLESVRRILEMISKLPENQRNEIHHQIRQNLGEEGKLLNHLIPEMEEVLGSFPPDYHFIRNENEVFFEKLKDFYLTVASSAHPLVLSFDDVHYWDHGSVQYFSYFYPFIEESSVYMILSLREEEALKVKELYDKVKEEAQKENMDVISLHDLSPDEVYELIGEVFGTIYNGTTELAYRLHESTQGNPFLIIENIKTLVEEDIMMQKHEGWHVDLEKLSHFRFSSSIMDKILNRLSKLRKPVSEILSYAAILGKDFHYLILSNLVKEMKAQISHEKVLDFLNEGIQAGLIAQTLSEKGRILYSFVHDKILETLISQLTEKRIRKIHQVAAEMIEKEYEESDKIYKLAYHYLMAGKKNKAYTYNLQAGRLAMSSFSFRLAVRFYYSALQILRDISNTSKKTLTNRIKLGLEIVNINFQLGEFHENISLLEELLELAETGEDLENQAHILYYLAKNHYFNGDQVKAMEYYYRVIPIAESLDMPQLLAIPYCAIGRANSYIAQFKEAIDFIQKGLQLLPEEEILEHIYSLGIMAQCYAALGRKIEATETIRQLQDHYAEIDNELYLLYIYFFKASIDAMVGDPVQGIAENQKAYDMAKEMKNPMVSLNALFNLGRAYSNQGKFTESIKYINRAIYMAKENQIYLGLSMLYFTLAENYVVIGQHKLAREAVEEGEKVMGISNPPLMKQWKLRILAICELISPSHELEKGLEYVEESIEACKALGPDYNYHLMHCYLVKAVILWEMEKDVEEAERLYRQAVSFFEERSLQNDMIYAQRAKEFFSSDTFFGKSSDELENTYTMTFTGTQAEFSYQRQLKYLLKLSEQLARVHEMDALISKIMSLAIEVSGAERGILFLYQNPADPQSPLEVKAKKSIDPREEQSEMAYSEEVLLKTLKTAKGQLVIDAEDELVEDKSVIQFRMKSIITVPLVTGGRLLGAIYLDNRQVKGLFNAENFELLKAFAIEAAISIENAKLYQQVQEKARIEQELEIAKDIQTSILPTVKDTDNYHIGTFMRTAAEVGGDYYDFFLTEEPFFGVFGDVSGHGLKSGLVMMMAEVAFNILMTDKDMREKDISYLYQQINYTLYKNIQERLSRKSKMGNQYSHMYMTFRLFRFDQEGNFEMFGNDHAMPFICRADTGEIEAIQSTGFLIGIMEDAILNNSSYSFKLNPGDLLVLFSDGITEAREKNKDETKGRSCERNMFGDKRLYDVVSQNRHEKPEQIIHKVIQKVDNWMCDQEDDITMSILKKK
jgi:serine/threonine protein kinase/serine phosphatase RsbU (regulator of sigma subunit)